MNTFKELYQYLEQYQNKYQPQNTSSVFQNQSQSLKNNSSIMNQSASRSNQNAQQSTIAEQHFLKQNAHQESHSNHSQSVASLNVNNNLPLKQKKKTIFHQLLSHDPTESSSSNGIQKLKFELYKQQRSSSSGNVTASNRYQPSNSLQPQGYGIQQQPQQFNWKPSGQNQNQQTYSAIQQHKHHTGQITKQQPGSLDYKCGAVTRKGSSPSVTTNTGGLGRSSSQAASLKNHSNNSNKITNNNSYKLAYEAAQNIMESRRTSLPHSGMPLSSFQQQTPQNPGSNKFLQKNPQNGHKPSSVIQTNGLLLNKKPPATSITNGNSTTPIQKSQSMAKVGLDCMSTTNRMNNHNQPNEQNQAVQSPLQGNKYLYNQSCVNLQQNQEDPLHKYQHVDDRHPHRQQQSPNFKNIQDAIKQGEHQHCSGQTGPSQGSPEYRQKSFHKSNYNGKQNENIRPEDQPDHHRSGNHYLPRSKANHQSVVQPSIQNCNNQGSQPQQIKYQQNEKCFKESEAKQLEHIFNRYFPPHAESSTNSLLNCRKGSAPFLNSNFGFAPDNVPLNRKNSSQTPALNYLYGIGQTGGSSATKNQREEGGQTEAVDNETEKHSKSRQPAEESQMQISESRSGQICSSLAKKNSSPQDYPKAMNSTQSQIQSSFSTKITGVNTNITNQTAQKQQQYAHPSSFVELGEESSVGNNSTHKQMLSRVESKLSLNNTASHHKGTGSAAQQYDFKKIASVEKKNPPLADSSSQYINHQQSPSVVDKYHHASNKNIVAGFQANKEIVNQMDEILVKPMKPSQEGGCFLNYSASNFLCGLGGLQSNNVAAQFEKESNSFMLNKNLFTFHYVVGKGGFGKVWKVEHKKTKKLWAMKEMSKSNIEKCQSLTYHSLLNGGDLRYHIEFFVANILVGLEYLHKHDCIHRDIKPENLVLDIKGYVRITDLGIARILKPDNSNDTSGTPGYMAPEVMCRQNHGVGVDFFALGVITYEFMLGRRPYLGRSRKEIRDAILAKQVQIKKHEIPSDWSLEGADFVNRIIQRKPMNRLGAQGVQEIKNHPWLKNFPWQKLINKEIKAPFLPSATEDNFDYKQQITVENTNEELIQQNALLLRRNSVQDLFNGYDCEIQSSLKPNVNAQIKLENYQAQVSSSNLQKRPSTQLNNKLSQNCPQFN